MLRLVTKFLDLRCNIVVDDDMRSADHWFRCEFATSCYISALNSASSFIITARKSAKSLAGAFGAVCNVFKVPRDP